MFPGSWAMAATAALASTIQSSLVAGISASSGKIMTSYQVRCCGEQDQPGQDECQRGSDCRESTGPRGIRHNRMPASTMLAASASASALVSVPNDGSILASNCHG